MNGKVKHLVGISLKSGSFVTNLISCNNVGLSKLLTLLNKSNKLTI